MWTFLFGLLVGAVAVGVLWLRVEDERQAEIDTAEQRKRDGWD